MNSAGPSNSSGGSTGGNTGGGSGPGPGGQPPHRTPVTPEQRDKDRKDRKYLTDRAKNTVKSINRMKAKLKAENQARPQELREREELLSSPELREKENQLVDIAKTFEEIKNKMVSDGTSKQPLSLPWEQLADCISKINELKKAQTDSESHN